jgi:hypothetical protein
LNTNSSLTQLISALRTQAKQYANEIQNEKEPENLQSSATFNAGIEALANLLDKLAVIEIEQRNSPEKFTARV